MQRRNKSIALFLLLTLCTCCTAYIPTKTGKIESIVESYFKGNGQEMFFVKPILLQSSFNRLTTDFTLVVPDSIRLVRSNISMFSKESIQLIDSIKLGDGSTHRNLQLMFKDYSKKTKQIRYTFQFPTSEFRNQLNKPVFQITTFSNGKSETFVISKKWPKIKNRINEVIFPK